MKWLAILLLSSISIYSWKNQDVAETQIGYYYSWGEGKAENRSTFCVDSFGRVHIYSGSVIKSGRESFGEKQVFSVCVESHSTPAELEKIFDDIGIVVIHPPLRSW